MEQVSMYVVWKCWLIVKSSKIAFVPWIYAMKLFLEAVMVDLLHGSHSLIPVLSVSQVFHAVCSVWLRQDLLEVAFPPTLIVDGQMIDYCDDLEVDQYCSFYRQDRARMNQQMLDCLVNSVLIVVVQGVKVMIVFLVVSVLRFDLLWLTLQDRLELVLECD